MIANATDDWLDSVGWGLAYPDLVRVIGFPFLAPKSLDRGYALEKDWQRTLKKPTLTLNDWYKKAKNGDILIPVFNSTLVENGRRFLISPMKFLPGEMADYLNGSEESKQAKALDFRTLYCGKPEEKKPCNLDVTTAARLSASFPYVSPMARNNEDNKIVKDGKSITIQEFAISFPQKDVAGKNYNQPLSWRLTQKQKENLEEAWVKDETIRNTVHCLESFWNNDQIDFKVCKNLS